MENVPLFYTVFRIAEIKGIHLLENLKLNNVPFASEILNGQRSVTGDTALRLGHFFGTSPEFWLNLQKIFELRLAEKKSGETIRTLPRLSKPMNKQSNNAHP